MGEEVYSRGDSLAWLAATDSERCVGEEARTTARCPSPTAGRINVHGHKESWVDHQLLYVRRSPYAESNF